MVRYVPHVRKLCFRGRFAWLLGRPWRPKVGTYLEERAALFFLVWPLRSKNDIFRCVSAAKLRKSSGDWTPPLACVLKPCWKWVALNMARAWREEKLFGAIQVPCPSLSYRRGCSNKQHVIWVMHFRLIAGYSPPASHGPHSAPKRKKLGLWA